MLVFLAFLALKKSKSRFSLTQLPIPIQSQPCVVSVAAVVVPFVLRSLRSEVCLVTTKRENENKTPLPFVIAKVTVRLVPVVTSTLLSRS